MDSEKFQIQEISLVIIFVIFIQKCQFRLENQNFEISRNSALSIEFTTFIFLDQFRRSPKCKQSMLDSNQHELRFKKNWRKKENCNLLIDLLENTFQSKLIILTNNTAIFIYELKYRQIHHSLIQFIYMIWLGWIPRNFQTS